MPLQTFGLEIECEGSRDRIHDEFVRSGIPVQQIRSHLGWDATRWTIKRDGSLSGEAAEVVSPILDFDNPEHREMVNRAVAAIQRAGGAPMVQAGIHVHVGASDLTPRQVAAVGRFFYKFEDQLYRIASSGWRTIRRGAMTTYAPPIGESVINRLTRVRDQRGFLTAWYGSESAGRYVDHHDGRRYCGVNLHAWNLPAKTIEFRLFNSSLNTDRIQAYIALSVAIVTDARNGFSRSIGKQFRLGAMREGEVSEKSAFLRLQQVLTTNSADTKRCMSKEDWKRVRMCWKDSQSQARVPDWTRSVFSA